MKNKLDATHIVYLLELFEGRISTTEILDRIPINLLLEMQKIKEEQIERQNKEIAKQREISSQRSSNKGGIITNTGKRRFD